MGKTSSVYTDENKGKKSISNSSPSYQISYLCFFRNIHIKVDHHTGGKWFIRKPKHRKAIEFVVAPLTLLLVIISIECKFEINEVRENLLNPFP